MGFEHFAVELSPHQAVYFPGQVVRGYVQIVAAYEVSCRGVSATAKGVGEVMWKEQHGKSANTYSAEEEYMRKVLTLWRGADTDNKMAAGHYKFLFQFEIPLNVPSSFKGTHGEVRYQVKAVADVPWGFDCTSKTSFSVNHLYDLNTIALSQSPILAQKEKTVGCSCLGQGRISLSVTAERSGYVPGENIIINGEIVNGSRAVVKYTEAKIIQNIRYITWSKVKNEPRTVQRVYRPQILPGGRDEWTNVVIPVPALPASVLEYCNIIDLNYSFLFMAKLGTCKSAKVRSQLVIGSVPLEGTYPSYVSGQGAPAQSGGTSLVTSINPRSRSPSPLPLMVEYFPYGTPSSSLPESWRNRNSTRDDPPSYTDIVMPSDYKDVPPPSYRSCMFHTPATGNDTDDDEGGFVPHYVTYTLDQNPESTTQDNGQL